MNIAKQHFKRRPYQTTMTDLCFIISKNAGFAAIPLLTLTLMSMESYASTNYYVRNTTHDDVYFPNEQLTIFETESKLMCLMLCDSNEQCTSMSYNSLNKRCQHFLVAFWGRPVIGINESGWLHYDPFIRNCKDLHDNQFITGIYSIFTRNYPSFKAKCDMDFDGGGWTIIQRRFDGTVDFQMTWMEYKTGFGSPNGEFWIGNDQIHALTASGDDELRVDISDWNGTSWYAMYKTFKVGDENYQYKLTISNYSGNAGDSMSYHNGMNFSTMDRDNDVSDYDCSTTWGGNGGWWYRKCDRVNLNSLYGKDIGSRKGIEWETATDDPFYNEDYPDDDKRPKNVILCKIRIFGTISCLLVLLSCMCRRLVSEVVALHLNY